MAPGKVPAAKEKACCDKSGGSINNSDSKGLEHFKGLQQFNAQPARAVEQEAPTSMRKHKWWEYVTE